MARQIKFGLMKAAEMVGNGLDGGGLFVKTKWIAFFASCLLGLTACRQGESDGQRNQQLANTVDLKRFMGKWYVHGYTPTFLDKHAVNATETYQLDSNGKILTTYVFRKKSPSGSSKIYKPVGWVHDEQTNAEWKMRFFGIFVASYYIVYVSEDYKYTVVGHPNKRLAWIMSRSPNMEEKTYDRLVNELVDRDYDLERFQRMRQEW